MGSDPWLGRYMSPEGHLTKYCEERVVPHVRSQCLQVKSQQEEEREEHLLVVDWSS